MAGIDVVIHGPFLFLLCFIARADRACTMRHPVQQTATSRGMTTTASLERVMDGLGESEKYNAVLQGVSSILMGKKKGGATAAGAFEEVFQLLDEMHANRIKCTLRTASSVVDAAAATTNISIITNGEDVVLVVSDFRHHPAVDPFAN